MENFDFQSLGETGSVVVAFLFVAWKIADMWFKFVERSDKSRNEMLARIGEACHEHQKQQNQILIEATQKITQSLDENTQVLTRFRDSDIKNIATIAAQEYARNTAHNPPHQ